MLVNGKNIKTVWMEGATVYMIEQNLLPFEFKIIPLHLYTETCHAIKTMIVRGAGAIGVSAGFAMAQAIIEAPELGREAFIEKAKKEIEATRPTAYNLFYAVNYVFHESGGNKDKAVTAAQWLAQKDADDSKKIGEFGSTLIKEGFSIATHCNAGWLAFTDYGTALSPIYMAKRQGKNMFVYVDETRPRGQGARLTAWELQNEQIPFAIIPDNAGAYYMSQGKIDLMIVGADRIAANGDTANKIGTFEKAIIAHTFGIPFYVAAPSSTFDSQCKSGQDIIIEERDQNEVLYQTGIDENHISHTILVAAPGAKALNPAFDVTPASYITGFITEKGIINATPEAISHFLRTAI